MPLGSTVVLDANVLYPSDLRDFLLQLAAADLFKPRWSLEIHREWVENLLENNPTLLREKLEATRDKMDGFFPQSLVVGYEHLMPQLTNHPDDRHVLATAIRAQARYIATLNLKDFKPADLSPYNVEAIHPDLLTLGLYQASPHLLVNTIKRHR
jgi:predicted nucleic acid-binding protein